MSKVTVYGREDPSGTVRQIEFNPHFAGLRAAEGRKCGHQPVRVLEYVTNRHYLAIDRKSRPSGAWERNSAQLTRRYSLRGRRELVGPTGIASLACQSLIRAGDAHK